MPRKLLATKMTREREKEAKSGPESSELFETLKSMADPERTAGMNKYGINNERAPGISMPWLRQTEKSLGRTTPLLLNSGRQESMKPESLPALLKIDLYFLMLHNF
jgi:hypothetical protein